MHHKIDQFLASTNRAGQSNELANDLNKSRTNYQGLIVIIQLPLKKTQLLDMNSFLTTC